MKVKTTKPTSYASSRRRRMKAMAWSFLFIVLSAMILPTASYLVSGEQAFAQVTNDQNHRANFWRAVREGASGYSAVSGPEAGVFINNGGQNWRQLRNGMIANYGGWAIVLGLGAIALFFLIRGRIKIDEEASGMSVPRWKTWERVMHWYTAILFVLLAISGLSMLFGRAVLIPLLGAKGFSAWANLSINVHNYVGPFFAIGVFAMLLFWVKNNIPNATDMAWFGKGGGLFSKAHPSAGKLNGGEKVWFWIVIFVGLIAVCGSGLVLIGWMAQWGLVDATRSTMQLAHQVHSIASIIWIVVFFGHAYIGTLGTEGALEGMTTGRVSVEWAKQHHDLWYEEVKDQAGVAETNTGTATPSTSAS
jgi:formate dehydrogenase subunit gamma